VIFLGHLLAELLAEKTLLVIKERKKQVKFAHAISVQSTGLWCMLTLGEFDFADLLAVLFNNYSPKAK